MFYKKGLRLTPALFYSLQRCYPRFGPAAGVSFSSSLKRNKTLTVLDFTDNRLSEEVGEKFLELLQLDNTALIELGLSRVEVGMRVWDEVEEIMSGRR